MENVGFVVLAGHAKNATFDVEKAEEVDIKQLEADTLSIKISKVKTYLGEGRKDIFSNGNGLMKLNKIKAKEKKRMKLPRKNRKILFRWCRKK